MKILLVLLIMIQASYAAIGNSGNFKGKIVGINGEQVTVETSKGNKVTVSRKDLDPPQENPKVNQEVNVKIIFPGIQSKKK